MATETRDLTQAERLRVLEVSTKLLTDQMADIVVEHRDMEQRIEAAVKRGVQDGLSEAFEALIARKKREAAEGTGRWLWALFKDFFIRWALIASFVLAVAKFGGWSLAAQVWDAITGGKK